MNGRTDGPTVVSAFLWARRLYVHIHAVNNKRPILICVSRHVSHRRRQTASQRLPHEQSFVDIYQSINNAKS